MKRIAVVIFLVFTFTSIFAQHLGNVDMEKCEKMILVSLKSDNHGVVKDMIFHLALFDISGQKELITEKVLKELDYLHENGATEKIKEFAGITAELARNDRTDVRSLIKDKYHNADRLFSSIQYGLKEDNQILANNK